MSKWGSEEKETLDKIGILKGKILNVAAGDGRFNNKLLQLSDSLVAIDNDDNELDELVDNTDDEYMDKLITMNVDITKRFPFNDDSFDGIFCTGTLHLFKYEILVFILGEIKRVLKNNGYFVLDFATNVERFDQNNNRVFIDGEGSYSTSDAIAIFKEQFLDYDIDIQIGNFLEENLEDSAGYKYISGEFLVVSGTKKRRIIIR